MKVVILSDNRTSSPLYESEHGLSVYVEKDGYRLLFDTGASDLFVRNAERLQVDLSWVDYLFISHGHIDHTGGLEHFASINQKAKIVLSKHAVNRQFYSLRRGKKAIGTIINLEKYQDRLLYVEDNPPLPDGILAKHIDVNQYPKPHANRTLFKMQDDELVHDDFQHEIVVAVGTDELFVYTGCAHHGLLNMLQTVTNHSSKPIHHVVGGFHLLDGDDYETPEEIREIANDLKLHYPQTYFYTGHCTGDIACSILKTEMPEQLQIFSVGFSEQNEIFRK